LSGVVITFDKFNPAVGKPIGVPLAGEVMPSRWAYEAFMVTQFKDNPYEKLFYPMDQALAEAEYKRVYYIPALESKLAYCLNNHSQWHNRNSEKMTSSITVLRNEIKNELRFVGEEHFTEVERLDIGKVDSALLEKTSKFLKGLRKYYGEMMDTATKQKERLEAELTSTPERTEAYKTLRNTFANKAVTEGVENRSTLVRRVEYKGRLIQRIYPIYMDDHRPEHRFDFSANLISQPNIYRYYNTLYFNITVIWCMTGLLFITLYLDALKRLIKRLEGGRKYRVKEK
jgi:hypothetical protein